MFKYRLIKEYPNSPELGYITDETMYFPSSYPEFWEKIVEKEWEIITAKIHTATVRCDIDGIQCISGWEIKSIKRLSDNTIFSIGDKIKMIGQENDKSPESITKIELNKKGIPCLFTNTFHNNGVNIFKAIKSTHLIITEDKIELYQGDECYAVMIDDYEIKYGPLFNYLTKERCKIFAKEKAAKEWAEMNKPQYSKKDLLDASINMQYGGWFIDGLIKRISK